MSTNEELAVRNGHTARERALLLQLDYDPVAARQKRAHCQHDAGNHILDANCVYEAGVYDLFCLPESPDLFTVRFTAPTAYAAGDAVRIGDVLYRVMTLDGVAAPAGEFAAGSVVRCDVDREQGIVFFAGVNPTGSMGRDEIEDALAGKAERTAAFVDCDCAAEPGAIVLTPRTALPDPKPAMVTVRFVAGADYMAGDVARLNGVDYPLLDANNKPLPDDAFSANAVVDLHIGETAAFFKFGVGDGSGPGGTPGLDGWTISTGDDAVPVEEGIHIPAAVKPSRIYVDWEFNLRGPVKQISLDNSNCYFLLSDGRVLAAGSNICGQLLRDCDDGTMEVPNLGEVFIIDDVKYVHGLNVAVHFIKNDGTVWNAGQNAFGRLGRTGPSGSRTEWNLGQVETLANIVSVTGRFDTHFLDGNGRVWNCGHNLFGQLGRVVASGSETVNNLGCIENLTDVIQVAVGGASSFFLLSDGTVYSCGNNNFGQLGRNVPTGSETTGNLGQISGLTDIIKIAASDSSTFFLRRDGIVFNCGRNNQGELGRIVSPGSSNRTNLGELPNFGPVKDIYVLAASAFFIMSDGKVWSCGYNDYGQLGRVVVSGGEERCNLGCVDQLHDIISISGYMAECYFIQNNGTIWNCGSNAYGILCRQTENGSRDFSNLGVLDLAPYGVSEFEECDYEEKSLLIKNGIYNPGRVGQIYNCGINKARIVPSVIYQVENGVPIRKDFEIRSTS